MKLCEQELNWKKSTTYTVLKRLWQKGIVIQTGSSRDERFTVDETTLEEVQQIVADAGGTLTLVTPAGDNPWENWKYVDTAQGITYWFTVSQGKVTIITEEQRTAEASDGQQERKGVLLMGY